MRPREEMRVELFKAIPKAGNEVSVADGVALDQPPGTSLVDPVHHFDSLQRPPCILKWTVSFCQPATLLHGSGILLDDVVQEFALPQANTAGRAPSALRPFTAAEDARFLPTFTTLAEGLPVDCKAFADEPLRPLHRVWRSAGSR